MAKIDVYDYVINQVGNQAYQALRAIELLKKNESGHINRDDLNNIVHLHSAREAILDAVKSKLNIYMEDLLNDVRERGEGFMMEEYDSGDDVDEAM